MKRIVFILILALVSWGCENDEGKAVEPQKVLTEQDSIFTYRGSFIMAGNAAVLKGDKFIFQVKMDSVARALKDTVASYKTNNQPVIPVEIEGKVINNPESIGYSQLIEIKKVVNILTEKETNNNKQN